MPNPYVNKVTVNNSTVIDLTSDTVTPSVLMQGYTAHDASGAPIVGTATGGGSSAWTKVAETSYQVSTTSTSATTLATWETGDSSIWTSDKIVYIRIRDTAGKRAGYFYGSDNFFINYHPANGSTEESYSYGIRYIFRYKSDSVYAGSGYNGTSGYGVYADDLYSDGRIRIRQRYNATSSLTINGTYKVEVYLLDPAGGVPIFG